MKYIVTEDENGVEEIFMFPKEVNHDCMMEMLARIKNQTWGDWHRVFRKAVSAGFTDGIICWGESETLGIKSRKEVDALLIK